MYNFLSPDGITITQDDYPTPEKAKEALTAFVDRFKTQGYYSSNAGRIAVADLEDNCKFITV